MASSVKWRHGIWSGTTGWVAVLSSPWPLLLNFNQSNKILTEYFNLQFKIYLTRYTIISFSFQMLIYSKVEETIYGNHTVQAGSSLHSSSIQSCSKLKRIHITTGLIFLQHSTWTFSNMEFTSKLVCPFFGQLCYELKKLFEIYYYITSAHFKSFLLKNNKK